MKSLVWYDNCSVNYAVCVLMVSDIQRSDNDLLYIFQKNILTSDANGTTRKKEVMS